VWRSLRALGVRTPALDDAVQDVFVVVHRRLGEFEGRASVRTWLFAIVERVAANHRRGVQRKQAPLAPLDASLPSSAPDPADHAGDAQAARFVHAFLDTLDEGKRAVFVLSLVEQMSAAEIAEALGIPMNTVYSRLRSVRRAFREAALTFGGPHDE
jgi:RNA polymerase sigma-70 factor (ECF subfamily)